MTNNICIEDTLSYYLKQIGKISLLTQEEEYNLGKQCAAGDVEARNTLVLHNLKLVISIAKRYQGCGIPLLDIIQEGTFGLIKAADKFIPDKNCRFSTLASWWIRQSINRSLADKSRMIRIPANIVELINKIKSIQSSLYQKLNREPTEQEYADALGVDISKIEVALDISQVTSSLDTPINEDNDSNIGDLISDSKALNPFNNIFEECNKEIINSVLSTLSEKECKVISKRFGLNDQEPQTLEQIGQSFGVTKERIRQIETKALRKLRNPMRLKLLKEAL